MSIIEFALNDLACTGCIGKIKRGIERTSGVEKVKILSGTGKVRIVFDEDFIHEQDISQSIHKLVLRSFD